MAAIAGCAWRGAAGEHFDGIRVPDRSRYPEIVAALDLLKEREGAIYGALRKHVRTIDISLHYDSSGPFYDTIYLAEFAISRGTPYTASVIFHELIHVACNNYRRGGPRSGEIEDLLGPPGVHGTGLRGMGRRDEELLAHGAQEKFLLKYGSQSDIEYQRLRMKVLFDRIKR
jgi:hypothetical protein